MTTNSVQIDVAADIRLELDNGTFSQTFTPVRQIGEVDLVLEESNDLKVDVVPYRVKTRQGSRGCFSYLVTTSILVRKKFPQSVLDSAGRIPLAQTDLYVTLLQEINDFFLPSQETGASGRKLTNVPEATWQETEEKNEDGIIGPYSKYLNEEQQFIGIVRVTYEVSRIPVLLP